MHSYLRAIGFSNIKKNKEIDKFKVKKDKVIKLYIDNQIDDTDYKKYIDLYNSKINLLTLELSNINLDAYKNKDEDLDILFNSTIVRNKIIELLLNKIVTIKYFEVTKDSKTDKYGLRFPTWTHRIRDDKDDKQNRKNSRTKSK